MQRSNSALHLSESRKKRSTTNLANLRLAPLSSKYADGLPHDRVTVKTPHEERTSTDFVRHHSSYLQGKSAPTTPGILSRTSSRAHTGGGLSRRSSLYEEDEEESSDTDYAYGAVAADYGSGVRSEIGSGLITKAKSEGILLAPRHHRRQNSNQLPTKKKTHQRTLTGSNTPKSSIKPQGPDDEWLSRACAATNVLLKESKGQSWLSSRESSTTLVQLDSADDDDDGYEEAAAMSASTATKTRGVSTNISPQLSRWGSRYGSRANSRRGSRRGSMSSMRTPTAMPGHPHSDSATGYFDGVEIASKLNEEAITSPIKQQHQDEEEVARLTAQESFGLGSMVDRLMGFNLFNVEERDETTDDDKYLTEDETEQQANMRMSAEAIRRRQEKEQLVAPPAPLHGANGMVQMESGGWADAAWLLSLATKVMF